MGRTLTYIAMSSIIAMAAYGIVKGPAQSEITSVVDAAIDNRIACIRATNYGSHMSEAICRWADEFEAEADKVAYRSTDALTLHNYSVLKKMKKSEN